MESHAPLHNPHTLKLDMRILSLRLFRYCLGLCLHPSLTPFFLKCSYIRHPLVPHHLYFLRSFPQIYGKPYLSWVWVNTYNVDCTVEGFRLASGLSCLYGVLLSKKRSVKTC
ncbi:hypothetical protein Naga_100164g7 [Nannochloropsis gaditana]|uniref:Uncharacterized protein n=1 Tax=Nannochloropsis gaditana TaxID=72520 RepID=W7T276_9STRA|nr:hypothetical protein Naga_100164g7 [Nannochloropsis gaditana]